jgi:hypothetical protein
MGEGRGLKSDVFRTIWDGLLEGCLTNSLGMIKVLCKIRYAVSK